MKIKFFLILSFLFFSTPTRAALHPASSSLLKNEPSLAMLMKAFEREQGISLNKFQVWEKQIRKSAWFPVFSVGYDHQLRASNSITTQDNTSISGGVVTVGPEEQNLDVDNVSGQVLRVRALWHLDETVFSSKTLALAREHRLTLSLRENARAFFLKIYETRALLLAQYLNSPRTEKGRMSLEKFKTLTNEIDALTGEEFTDKFWRGK